MIKFYFCLETKILFLFFHFLFFLIICLVFNLLFLNQFLNYDKIPIHIELILKSERNANLRIILKFKIKLNISITNKSGFL